MGFNAMNAGYKKCLAPHSRHLSCVSVSELCVYYQRHVKGTFIGISESGEASEDSMSAGCRLLARLLYSHRVTPPYIFLNKNGVTRTGHMASGY